MGLNSRKVVASCSGEGWLWLAFSSSLQLDLSEHIQPSWLAKPKWTIRWWLSAWKTDETGQEKKQPH